MISTQSEVNIILHTILLTITYITQTTTITN
jgi:hypothetical protein